MCNDEIKEIYKRLGLKNYNLENIEQLKNFTLDYNKNFFELNSKDKRKQRKIIENYINVLSIDQPIIPIFYYRRVIGWRVILDPKRKDEVKRYEPPFLKISIGENDVDNAINTRGKFLNLIDGGHLLGQFTNKYFNFESFFGDHKKEKIKRNRYDEFPQFSRANRNRKTGSGENGQEYFENQVSHFDDKIGTLTTVFYYEVEAIFKEKEDKIPIGTRLYVLNKNNGIFNFNTNNGRNKNKLKVPFHVFIPNCDYFDKNEDFIMDTATSQFFKNGSIEYLNKIDHKSD